MQGPQNDPSPTSQAANSEKFRLAEYAALRDEILKYTELQHQLVSIAILGFGSLVAAGVQTRNAQVILIYPIVAYFLCLGWGHFDHDVRDTGAYIRENIEQHFGVDGWENHLHNGKHAYFRYRLAGGGAFLVTEAIAILIGVAYAHFGSVVMALLSHTQLPLLDAAGAASVALTGLDILGFILSIPWLLPYDPERAMKKGESKSPNPPTEDKESSA